MHVTICITTCGRPDGLTRLLESVERLNRSAEVSDLEVLVADNHPDECGRDVSEAFAHRLPIRYVVESRRGIPFARNAAVTHASPTTDFIAFVDDDETVDPDWLDELMAVQMETGADVVTGPSIPEFPSGAPEWLVRSGAFDLLSFETGSERPFAFTHNVLARRVVYDTIRPNFDERLVNAGGSDTHFFKRVRDGGFRIVWADQAIAREWIPKERLKVGWLLRRALRIGGTDTYIQCDLAGHGVALRTVPLRAMRYVVRGVLRCLTFPVRGRAGILNGARDWAHALGLITGLIGYRYREYKVKD